MSFLNRNAHWLLRLALASVFLNHGLNKFLNIGQLAWIMKIPAIIIFIMALIEITGAALIIIGAFLKTWVTRLGAVLLIPVTLSAIFILFCGQWGFSTGISHLIGSMQLQVTMLFIELYFLIKPNKKYITLD